MQWYVVASLLTVLTSSQAVFEEEALKFAVDGNCSFGHWNNNKSKDAERLRVTHYFHHQSKARKFSPFVIKSVSRKSSRFQIKATSSEESAVDAGEIFTDIKEKVNWALTPSRRYPSMSFDLQMFLWDAIENKSIVILYGGGALVGIWLSSVLVGAINSVPLSSRKKLATTDIESLKKKIAGTEIISQD